MTDDVAHALIEKVEARHPNLPEKLGGLVAAVKNRMAMGRKATDGQLKLLRSIASSPGFDWQGKPRNWKGPWVL